MRTWHKLFNLEVYIEDGVVKYTHEYIKDVSGTIYIDRSNHVTDITEKCIPSGVLDWLKLNNIVVDNNIEICDVLINRNDIAMFIDRHNNVVKYISIHNPLFSGSLEINSGRVKNARPQIVDTLTENGIIVESVLEKFRIEVDEYTIDINPKTMYWEHEHYGEEDGGFAVILHNTLHEVDGCYMIPTAISDLLKRNGVKEV